MRRFNIAVNGKAYDVAVEEIGAGATTPAAPVAAASVPTPAPAAVQPTAAPASEGAVKVLAPMPGTIMDVKVSVGDTVTEAQVVAVLEAMKMENDIVAPSAGKVVSVAVKKGDTVNSGDVLVTIE